MQRVADALGAARAARARIAGLVESAERLLREARRLRAGTASDALALADAVRYARGARALFGAAMQARVHLWVAAARGAREASEVEGAALELLREWYGDDVASLAGDEPHPIVPMHATGGEAGARALDPAATRPRTAGGGGAPGREGAHERFSSNVAPPPPPPPLPPVLTGHVSSLLPY